MAQFVKDDERKDHRHQRDIVYGGASTVFDQISQSDPNQDEDECPMDVDIDPRQSHDPE